MINRTFTYGRRIKLNSDDLRLAKEERKTCTIRLGKLGVSTDEVIFTDGREEVKARIEKVDNSRVYSELTDEEARLEGLGSLAELDDDLAKYYGKIDPMQPVTVIYFSLIK